MNKDHHIHKKDEMNSLVMGIMHSFFSSKDYNSDESQNWSNHISEEVAKALKAYNENYKYCIVSMIFQKGDSGMDLNCFCFWDNSKDSCFSIKYENNSMFCIVNFFCLLNKI